ncbi:MAG TPA: GAF domain-containing protein, partial [Thermodesulfovibrionales bacterium]|nr:GAF domain-containing protein [Thermodesulfovibrionales bacterium]
MTLRSKIRVFVFFFLIFTAVFAAGSFVIFDHLSNNFEVLTFSAEEHNLYEELLTSVKGLSRDAKTWALTGDVQFRSQYRKDLVSVYASLKRLGEVVGHTETVESAKTDFEELKGIAASLIILERPVATRDVLRSLQRLEEKEEEMNTRLRTAYLSSIQGITRAIVQGERIKKEVAFYLVLLLIMISLGFVLLVLFMRRVIAVPFHDILTATDRITSGDLKYRIGSKRTDEFGVIAERFDRTVDELQKISAENEDLYLSTRSQLQKLATIYELAKALTSTLDLNELLDRMAEESTHLLHARGCIIRLIEGDKLIVRASFGIPKEKEGMMTLSIGEGLPGKVAEGKRAILVGDLSTMPSEWKIPNLDARSVMNVPLLFRGTVIGTFALYDKMAPDGEILPFSGDDLATAEGFASLSAIAIAKAKMYELELQKEREILEAKGKLDVLFESVQGGIINIGKDFTIISVNRFVEQWVGYASDDLCGKNALEVFHGKKGICPHCVAQVTFETGEIHTMTQVSGLNYAELTSYPIKDEDGGIRESVVYIQDITDRVLY